MLILSSYNERCRPNAQGLVAVVFRYHYELLVTRPGFHAG